MGKEAEPGYQGNMTSFGVARQSKVQGGGMSGSRAEDTAVLLLPISK